MTTLPLDTRGLLAELPAPDPEPFVLDGGALVHDPSGNPLLLTAAA